MHMVVHVYIYIYATYVFEALKSKCIPCNVSFVVSICLPCKYTSMYLYVWMQCHAMSCHVMPMPGDLCMLVLRNFRSKLRSETSDNMDRWKSRGGKSQKKEEGTRKGRKVPRPYVFQRFVAQEGRKVGSLKGRVRSHVGRWEMKNCMPL